MFSSAFDAVSGNALWLFSGSTNTDADYQAYVDSIHQTLQACGPRQDLPAAILLVDAGNPVPNAAWRKRIADASAAVPCPMLFAVVSDSILVRGAITAVNWIRPPPYEIAVHEKLDGAVRWIEEKRGKKTTMFQRLHDEARRGAPSPSSRQPQVR